MDLEMTQAQIRLTKNPEILRQLKETRALKHDANGDFFTTQYDSLHFRFRPGQAITLGKRVADNLVRSTMIIAGDDKLSGEMTPILEIVKVYDIGENAPIIDSVEGTRRPICPYCKKNLFTPPRLARHIMSKHSKKSNPELYDEPKKDAVDWEAPVEEDIEENDE